MAVYIFTGKLGGGKTLCAVGRIREKLHAGLPVATNLDLHLHQLLPRDNKTVRIIRLPDKPKIGDLHALPPGNQSYDETRNGLLVLDECGTWFNSRNWNDKDRKPVNDWFLHARKLGWDVILIIQDIKLLDSQARDALAEHTVFCRRLDRVTVPVIGSLFKAVTGYRLPGPRVHIAKAVYGTSPQDLLADRWVYRGTDLFRAYDTKQLFLENYPHSNYSMLPPWYTHGRYQVARNWEFYMRLTKIYFKRLKAPAALAIGAMFGAFFGQWALPAAPIPEHSPAPLAENVTENPAPVDPPKMELKPEKPVSEVFAGWEIVGFIQNEKHQVFSVSNPVGDIVGLEWFRINGYQASVVDNCHILVSRFKTPMQRTSIFAPACTPLIHGKDTFDLDTLPRVQRFASAPENAQHHYSAKYDF